MIALALLLALQTGPVDDERGPPQESLLRAYEHISSVLCVAPERDAALREVGRRYAKRLRAVRDAVAGEYGAAAADRGYISVMPCYNNRWQFGQQRAADRAVEAFEHELSIWEKRYGLNGQRKAQGS